MKPILFSLIPIALAFSAEITSIPFPANWTTANGAFFSNDTLKLTGTTGKYAKAQLKVKLPSNPTNLYFTADIRLDGVVVGAKSTSVPKFKIYDGSAGSLQAFNIDPLVQGEWYQNGMVLESFSKLGLTEILIELGMQDCQGTMTVTNPKLLDTPPTTVYSFPFDIPSANVSLDLKSSETKPFNNDLLSVNCHFVSSDPVSWSDTHVMSIFKDRLPLGNLRFPGGTVGNFYDWETDGFYGDEWTFISAGRKKAFDNGFKFDYPGYLANVKALNATSTLMFNVIKDSPQKAAAQLTSRLADGLKISYVELGNENFFADQSFGNVDAIGKYIDHTKAVTAALKAVDPTIKIAVNTDRHSYLAGDWNDLLSKETYFDACVVHPYTKTGTFLLNKPALRTIFGAYKSTKEAFAEHKKMYPTKPIVLSEWNILTEGSESNFAQALGVADEFMAIVEGGDDGTVVQSGFHTFCHSGENGEQTLYYGEKGNLKKTRLAVIYEKLVHSFKGTKIFGAKSVSAELTEGLPAINVRAVDQGDSIAIIAVNKLPVAAPLALKLDGSTVANSFVMESFTEPMIGESSYAINDNPWNKVTGSGSMTIPASSIAVITFAKGTTSIAKTSMSSNKISLTGTTISLPSAGNRTVELFSLSGRKILSKEISGTSVNLGSEQIASGIYSLLIKEKGIQVFSGKIVR